VAHACSPSYSGGRDQEISVQSQPWQIVHETLSQKVLHKKRVCGVAQGVGPWIQAPVAQKKKKKKIYIA
jgi:hypothetical protein